MDFRRTLEPHTDRPTPGSWSRLLRGSLPALSVLCILAAAPAFGAGISVITDADQKTAANPVVSITDNALPAGTLEIDPNPVKVAVGDEVDWSVSASAFLPGEVTAEIFIKPGQAVAAGVVAGPGGPGLLAGGLVVPVLPAGTVVKYGINFRDAGNAIVRTVDPEVVVTPGLGTAGLALLSVVLAGLGAFALTRRRSGAALGA
jgi:hypothetical protein